MITHILHKGNLNVRYLKGPSQNVPFYLNNKKKQLTSETKCVLKKSLGIRQFFPRSFLLRILY